MLRNGLVHLAGGKAHRPAGKFMTFVSRNLSYRHGLVRYIQRRKMVHIVPVPSLPQDLIGDHSRIQRIDSRNMVSDHAVPVAHLIEHRVSVLRRLGVGAGQGVAILPEQICGDARRVQGILLPGVLNRAVVGAAVLLEQAGLARGLACSAVRGDPQVAPAVGGAP